MVSHCFDDVNVYVSFLIFLFLMGALCSKLIVAVLFCQSCPFLLPDPLFSSQHVKKIVMYLSYLKLIRVRSLYHQPIKHLVCYPITIFQLLNIWFIAIQSLFFSHHTSGLLLPDHFFLAIKHLFIVIQSVLFSYQTSSLLLSNQ